MEKKIVITAQNISEGGPLTILNSLMNILMEDKKNNHCNRWGWFYRF